MKKDPWPFPGDSKLERSRKVCRSYRNALLSADPETCRFLDENAAEVGEGWVSPLESPITDVDELLSAEQISSMFFVSPRTVRKWGYRGHIERIDRDGKPRYRLRDVLDYQAKTRARSA
jgi:hypothetical protein